MYIPLEIGFKRSEYRCVKVEEPYPHDVGVHELAGYSFQFPHSAEFSFAMNPGWLQL
jgi:hypothetical protein